ncbi:citrate/2-methylcitrate synthase [Methylobacterium sp. JK268]
MTTWLDRDAVLRVLGVKPQTLYAYVSRGRIETHPDPADARRSLYRADDVAVLRARRGRAHKAAAIAKGVLAWGEPAIETGLSAIERGALLYRGVNAVAFADTASLEETAALLWREGGEIRFAAPAVRAPGPFAALAALAASSRATLGLGPDPLRRDAERAIGHLAGSLGVGPGGEPVHHRLARAWSLGAAEADRIRRALVLLADHDLNASTFAVRVAASTGASVAASLLAGLCALSGPRHGGAGAATLALMDEARRAGAGRAVAAWLARGHGLPGFGHPLYPEGDPRAARLLDGLPLDAAARDLRDTVRGATGDPPNIDFALAALTRAFRLPEDAPLSLFLLGRSVGWSAHLLEQVAAGGLIRPRGRYRGPREREGPGRAGAPQA